MPRPRVRGLSSGRAAERVARALVATRSGGLCEVGESTCIAADWHHRKNRSAGGLWSASNGLDVCRTHHQWITEHPAAARMWGWSVPSWGHPAATPAWLPGRGWMLLDDAGDMTGCPAPKSN